MNFFDSTCKKLHSEKDQLKRQKSALSLQMTSVDKVLKSGVIKNYSVTLENCTCVDFSRRQKPCKHMYRLAMDLGLFTADEKNLNKVKSKKFFRTYSLNYKDTYYGAMPKNFVVIDFETANDYFDSVCQIGIVVVENNSIVERKSFFICPPYTEFTNTEIHGITFDDVKNAPTFAELWSEIKNYFEGRTISAYNLFFDWSCLAATLDYYKIDRPQFTAFDILANARNWFDLPSYSLVNVAKALKFKHNAHEALSDSEVAAKVQIFISEECPQLPVNFYLS